MLSQFLFKVFLLSLFLTFAIPTVFAQTVSNDGTGDFVTINDAVNSAKAGDHIKVRAGVYNESVEVKKSGTFNNPIVIENYPNERPIIFPGNSYGKSVILRGEWIVFQGFEIRNGWDGVQVFGNNNVIRKNYIHSNGEPCPNPSKRDDCGGQGVLVVSADDILIEENLIERNGLQNLSPHFFHGIYASDYYHKNVSRLIVRNNIIKDHGGAGFHAFIPDNGSTEHLLLEGNTFINNFNEIVLVNVYDSIIRNNKITHNSVPKTTEVNSSILVFELTKNNSFIDNKITSTLVGSSDFILELRSSNDIRDLPRNTWEVPKQARWIYLGDKKANFLSAVRDRGISE